MNSGMKSLLLTYQLVSKKHLKKTMHHTQSKFFEVVNAFFIATISNVSILSSQSILIDTCHFYVIVKFRDSGQNVYITKHYEKLSYIYVYIYNIYTYMYISTSCSQVREATTQQSWLYLL